MNGVFDAISTRCVKSIVLLLRRRAEETREETTQGAKGMRKERNEGEEAEERMKARREGRNNGVEKKVENERTKEGQKEHSMEGKVRGANQFNLNLAALLCGTNANSSVVKVKGYNYG